MGTILVQRESDECHPAIDGTWKNFITDYGAVPDGTTDSSTAVDAWTAAASAANPATAKLYVPAGRYHLGGSIGITNGITNAIVSGWGAQFDHLFIGNFGSLVESQVNSARIQTANAGAASVTLITGAQISRFTIGGWILVSGLALQGVPSYPPNFHFFEYRQVSNIIGSTVFLSQPLEFSYLSTWPEVDAAHAGSCDLGGPATIYALTSVWGGSVSCYGIRSTVVADTGVGGSRTMFICGMQCDGFGFSPTVAGSITIRRSQIGGSNEVDKLVENLIYDQCTGGEVIIQSSSIKNFTIKNTTLTGIIPLNGLPKNSVIDNCVFSQVTLGPLFYGHGVTVAVSNSTITTGVQSNNFIDPSTLTFTGGGSGTFQIANTSAAFIWAWAVPGQKYFFARNGNKNSDSSGVVSFTITALRQDVTNTYIDTDMGGTLPTPTYGGSAANQYWAYVAATITQSNTGPADLTVFAAPP